MSSVPDRDYLTAAELSVIGARGAASPEDLRRLVDEVFRLRAKVRRLRAEPSAPAPKASKSGTSR